MLVWRPGETPPPRAERRRRRGKADETPPQPVQLKALAMELPADISFERMVDLAKLRWRIERDYEELKSEIGLAHFEGRGWRGFHHHATLCIAAYGFLIRERAAIPPCAIGRSQVPRLSDRRRPGSAADPPRASCRNFDRNRPKAPHGCTGAYVDTLSMLPNHAPEVTQRRHFVTQ